MGHKRSESAQIKTPERPTGSRPKSMFARFSPSSGDSLSNPNSKQDGPHIPSKSPRRLKRFSLMLKPPSEHVPEPVSPLRTPIRGSPGLQRSGSLQQRQYRYEGSELEEWPPSPRRSLCSVRSPSSLSVATASVNGPIPRTKPLFLDARTDSHLSSPKPSPSLLQSPMFETPTQNSVWIDEDKPAAAARPSLEKTKRSSLLGRNLSVKDSRRNSKLLQAPSTPSVLGSPVISSPQFLESSNPLTNTQPVQQAQRRSSVEPSAPISAPSSTPVLGLGLKSPKVGSREGSRASEGKAEGSAKTGPVIVPKAKPEANVARKPSTRAAQTPATPSTPRTRSSNRLDPNALAPQKSASKSPRIGQMLRRIFKGKEETKLSSKKSTPSASVQRSASKRAPAAAPTGGPSARPRASLDRRPTTKEEKQRKYQSASAIVSKPTPIQPPSRPSRNGLGLFRPASQLSLQSSNDSQNTGNSQLADLVTPTNYTASPRVHIQDWEFPSLNQRQWEENFSDKRQDLAWI